MLTKIIDGYRYSEGWNDTTLVDLLTRFLEDRATSSAEIEIELTEFLDSCCAEQEEGEDDELDTEWGDDDIQFADPGGKSALRAASENNPRNLPCPSCGEPDMLTPADKVRGYQCDACADKAERGGW